MKRGRASSRPVQAPAPGPAPSQRQYSAPRYYEIAFDMNRRQEVDFLIHCFRRYARRPVERVLDIACGTGPHLIRLAERGYRMSGLDLSPENIEFLRERAAQKGLDVELFVADMTRFRLGRPVDAALCMQDSQGHLLTNDAILAHLRCVRRALSPGGLYVFDRYMCSSWTDPARRWSWTRRRGRATVLEVFENGTREIYRQRHSSRMVFPQELRSLVELAGGFELCEWFYGFKPHLRLDTARHPLLMVVVLRRSGGTGSRRGSAR